MFSVYGQSKPLASKVVAKKLLDSCGDVFLEVSSVKSQQEKQSIIDKHVEVEFKSMKPKRCSQDFSTPEIAKECYQLMLKDSDNFSQLSIMKKIENKKSERTGKMTYKWVALGFKH